MWCKCSSSFISLFLLFWNVFFWGRLHTWCVSQLLRNFFRNLSSSVLTRAVNLCPQSFAEFQWLAWDVSRNRSTTEYWSFRPRSAIFLFDISSIFHRPHSGVSSCVSAIETFFAGYRSERDIFVLRPKFSCSCSPTTSSALVILFSIEFAPKHDVQPVMGVSSEKCP